MSIDFLHSQKNRPIALHPLLFNSCSFYLWSLHDSEGFIRCH